MHCQGQLRTAGMGGVMGLDMPAALQIGVDLGYDRRLMALLMPGCEAGVVSGYAELADREGDDPSEGVS